MLRLCNPSGDDWVVRMRCEQDGRKWTRWIGVSSNVMVEKAIWIATQHVNTGRRVRAGMACRIVDVDCARMWEWKARALVEKAPDHFGQTVEYWRTHGEKVVA